MTPFERRVPSVGVAAGSGVADGDLALVAVEHVVQLLGRQFLNGLLDREVVLPRERLEQAHVPGRDCAGARPRLDGALSQREVLVRDHELRVQLHLHAEPGALAASAVRAVEAEVARLEFAEGEAVVHAGEVFRVRPLFLREPFRLVRQQLHDHDAASQPQRGLDGVRQPRPRGIVLGLLLDHHPVDDHVDRVHLVAVERNLLVQVAHLAVDAHAHEPLLCARPRRPCGTRPCGRERSGASTISRLPGRQSRTESTICWTVWRWMGLPHCGQ